MFEICPASDGSAYKEYVLTEKGRSVFPIVIAMRQWGERYMFAAGEVHSVLVDNEYGQTILPLEVRSLRGQKLEPEECRRHRVVKGEK